MQIIPHKMDLDFQWKINVDIYSCMLSSFLAALTLYIYDWSLVTKTNCWFTKEIFRTNNHKDTLFYTLEYFIISSFFIGNISLLIDCCCKHYTRIQLVFGWKISRVVVRTRDGTMDNLGLGFKLLQYPHHACQAAPIVPAQQRWDIKNIYMGDDKVARLWSQKSC